MTSVFLVRSKRPSFWGSCISIVNNLETSYRSLYSNQIGLFNYHAELDGAELISQVRELVKERPEHLIFIDHYPPITKFIIALDAVAPEFTPQITIHTFGDFAPTCQEYLKIENILMKFPLKIIAPSKRAAEFLKIHFQNSEGLVQIVPFSVSEEEFFYDEEEALQGAMLFGIKDSTKVITYAGRMSSQKNFLFTLETVAEYLLENKSSHFYIAGSFDNFGTPLFNFFEDSGSIERAFKEMIKSFSEDVQKRIHNLGYLDQRSLRLLLNITDVYIGLSTYHNEDFGMAPLQALASGAPALISDWGGYSDFQLNNNLDDCRTLKVHLTDRGLFINKKDVLKGLRDFMTAGSSVKQRRERARKYSSNFSIDNVQKNLKLQQLVSHAAMNGFSPIPKNYFWINHGYAKLELKAGTFYEVLYRSFFE